MVVAQDIPAVHNGVARTVSSSYIPTASPGTSVPSPLSTSLAQRSRTANLKHLKPFATEDIKILLLENINQTGRELLEKQGYQVEFVKTSLPEDQLIEKIR